jgi:pimeloyl-ACP methyl ester carboxylesterase
MGFQFVPANGVNLHTSITGAGETIVLLHGFPEFWYCWRDVMEALPGYRIVAPDLRGYNESDKPEGVEHYTMRKLMADAAGLIEQVAEGPATLVGHDWGGAIAWVVAAFRPGLVRRLIIVNAPHPSIFTREILSNPEQQKASQYMHALSSPGAEARFSANHFAELKRAMGMRRWEPAVLARYEEAWSKPGALTAMLNYYRAMAVKPPDFSKGEPPLEGLRPADLARIPNIRIHTPTLVIWGERDHALLTGNLLGLEEYVPGLRIHRIPDASHWVPAEAPEEVARLIREFCAA